MYVCEREKRGEALACVHERRLYWVCNERQVYFVWDGWGSAQETEV